MIQHAPSGLTGVWRRELITTTDGVHDDTTQVFWLQTQSWYADIRVPADRPRRPGAAGWDDYAPAELAAMADMQGFAGELTVEPGICRWRRDLDFQPPNGVADEGTWDLDGDVMIERGLDGRYEEIWRLEPRSRGPLLAFALAGAAGRPGLHGLLVVAGDHFMIIQGRTLALPFGESLRAVVDVALAAGDHARARAALAMPIAYGRIADGSTPWEVRLSTWPWLEGAGLWSQGPVIFDAATRTLRQGREDAEQAWTLLDSSVDLDRIEGALRLPA